MKKVMVGVAVALALVTSNAAADGIDRRAPTIVAPEPYPPPLTWTGLYIGAGVGGGAAVHDHTIRDDVHFGDTHFNGIGDVGVFGTAIIGWDWQVSPTGVVGLFVDYDFSNISNDFALLDRTIRGTHDHEHSWSVGARLGMLSSPSTLWYTTGGYTQARFEGFTALSVPGGLELDVSHDRTFDGWFVGGGVDTRLGMSNWFLRMEYRFAQYDNERFFSDDELTRVEFEPTVHTVRTTITYKFGSNGWGANGWGWGWGR
jgi:outer membrane immunogenic protein